MTESNKPRKHHYVPQFFLKAWNVTENPNKVQLSVQDKKGDKRFKTNPENLFQERDLYSLDNEIESSFITPYIDSLSDSIHKIRQQPWETLTDCEKEHVLKFLLLLDARNPVSINKMREGCKPHVERCKEILKDELNQADKFATAFVKGVENGVLILVLTAIDEIGLSDFKDSKDKVTFNKIKSLIDECKSSDIWQNSYISNIMSRKTEIIEFEIKDKKLLSCNTPLYRVGDYANSFTMIINISPTKALFISNDNNLTRIYKAISSKIHFFNRVVLQINTSVNFIILNE